ncbi:putative membrane spanning protein [Granulibacter bethesdensis]|uniref:Membrane spanning protein n=1 Tax=Granulibacter bethesdensis TaxID=364410 RepID=A0AAN0RDP8_9PROT|nr:urate hydroxylase PuuD [Granulibacter bethesdensis]AHJ63048.1 putative membrane spanning protein [Granulibacter bethesdensis]
MNLLFPYFASWLELLLRWFHVVAGIAWIGESFYFVMLDRGLRSPPADAASRGVAGEQWAVHGGGFYHMQRYRIAPPDVPHELHWSKWKAYATWLSGFTLLSTLYLAQPGLYLVDPDVMVLPPYGASALAVGFLIGGWIIYDGLCRLLGARELALSTAVGVFVIGASWVGTHLFSGRAAFLIIGAMLATMMTANVLMVIIPGQKTMIAAMMRGETPDPEPGRRGRQRSVHNTYFTLPVVFTMISNHYAFTFADHDRWIMLCAIMLAGALTRQFFVAWHEGRRVWALPVSAAVIMAALIVWRAPYPLHTTAENRAAAPSFSRIMTIVQNRCTPCHSAHPTLMESAPAGLALDTADAIMANALRIQQQASVLKTMPLGNATHMTEEERSAMTRWVENMAHP